MKGCNHDRIFSGQSNLSCRYAWICRHCGECGWSEDYILSQVNLDEYLHWRVAHGWASPIKLPLPPRTPTNTTIPPRSAWPFVPATVFFTTLAAACALASIPWGQFGPIMPFWGSLLGTGLGLGTATICYVAWKKGL